jgi:hypothetical protein
MLNILAGYDFSSCHRVVRLRKAVAEQRALDVDGKSGQLESRTFLGLAQEPVTDGELQEAESRCKEVLRSMTAMLAVSAQRVGMDPQADSPFGKSAVRHGHTQWAKGGKLDDVVVVAGLVVPDC